MRIPTYCPNPSCFFHIYKPYSEPIPFWRVIGHYETKVSGKVTRFRCRRCGRGFSEQTISIEYYQKRRLDLSEIHRAASEGESVSAIARHLGCSLDSVQNRIDRIARNAMACHERLQTTIHLTEDLVADGFESFDQSQYFPNNLNILVGKDSQHLYGVTHVSLNRKGRMREDQKLKKKKLMEQFRAPRLGIEKSFASLLTCIGPLWDRNAKGILVLHTDEHKSYPRAIRLCPHLLPALEERTFIHEQWSSKIDRSTHNPLFPVNYYDRELRKDIPAFHRESVCFTRNVENGLSRFYNYQLWHNYRKPWRIVTTKKKPGPHASVAGVDELLIRYWLERSLVERMMPSQQYLTPEERKTWLRQHKTPLKEKPEYLQKFMQAGFHQASGD